MEDDSLFDRVINAFKHKSADSPEETAEPGPVAPEKPEPAAEPAAQGVPLPPTKSEGELLLIKTGEPTAAVIMAIISNQIKIPLNRLSFKSIKLLPEAKK